MFFFFGCLLPPLSPMIYSVERINISTYPVEISLNDDNKIIAWFRSCDIEELNNKRQLNWRDLLIPSLLLTDFEYLCLNHYPLYEKDKGIWYKVTEDCNCESREYLWCKKDINHRVGKDVINRASRALSILKEHGLYYKNIDSDIKPFITSFDDFMNHYPKRIFLLAITLTKIIELCKLLPYNVFGLSNDRKSTFNINFMINGEHSIIKFSKKSKVFYCRHCNVFGHTISYCDKMNNRCFRCRQFGHIYKNCTVK